jgi:hypothetical protein
MLRSLFTIAIRRWAVLLILGLDFVLIALLSAGGSKHAALAAVVGMTTATSFGLLWLSSGWVRCLPRLQAVTGPHNWQVACTCSTGHSNRFVLAAWLHHR